MFAYLNRGRAFYRDAALLALPILLQNLCTTLLGLMDTFMVGALGEAPLAAVLVADGILYKRRGIGMFVAKGAEEAVKQKRRDAFYDGYVKPLVKEGASLQLTGQELLDMIRRAIQEGEEA